MDTSSAAGRTAEPAGANAEPARAQGGWLRPVATLVILDIAVPLGIYSALRSAGVTAVVALVLGGVFPALSVTYNAIRHRRLEVVGALVLGGIAVGAVLGLVFHDARLMQVEGSVPTVVFAVACLGSLRARPLMFGMAVEFMGPHSANGREMTRLWRFEGYRQVWRVITAVWGAAFLAEAALRVVIIYTTSSGTSLAISKVTPYVFIGVMSAWTVAYGQYRKRKGERQAAAAGFDFTAPPDAADDTTAVVPADSAEASE